jgi:formate dehydrogenase major subunit
VIEGSNFAECHPVGFRWVMEAKRRGATIIHVDPRFTRTSAMADVHVPIRAGSDVAFLGGIVNYILENERWFKEYVLAYTNASAIVSKDFQDTEDLDGLFSGWNPETGQYDIESWQYEGSEVAPVVAHRELFSAEAKSQRGTHQAPVHRDQTLQDPNCVFQILKRHFARYTPENVEEVCGVPPALFLKVCEALCENSGRERTSAFAYAVGWTQHSIGVQYIRTAAIIQLLLGNVGRPGGGILALRGHASIQGSTDIPTLYNMLPGYLSMPRAGVDVDLKSYIADHTSERGWWSEMPKYVVSLLKAWWGEAATRETDFCYWYLPQLSGDHSHLVTVADMADGKVKGYFVMGENPTVGSMHGALHRKGLRAAEWVVVRDFAPTETAEFWRTAPEIERGEVRPEDIQTEVFFFPAAAHTEKDGSFTNTQRLVQWHHKAIEAPGASRSDLWFLYHLGNRLKTLYAGSADPKDRPVLDLTWEYPTQGEHEEPDAESVLAEISGYTVADRSPVNDYRDLTDDGSTACGCWIYSGSYKDGVNQTARKKPWTEQSWVAPQWAWSWPSNRRILYNRASADPEGNPWSERKRYVWWDAEAGAWTGEDEPDFIKDRPPSYRPKKSAKGTDTISGIDPFLMQGDGKGWLYAPNGLLDGPLPTHYEPQESVCENALYGQQCNPARMEWARKDNPYHRAFGDPRYPFVITTYRLTEHHTAGGMSRWLSWLAELQPEMFCEVSPELARERGLTNGGWATVSTARGEIEARVLVTERVRPLRLGKRLVHQIGLPYHWGGAGLVTGEAANELIAFVADPNVSIQESKCLTGNIQPGRRSRQRRVVTSGPLIPAEPGGLPAPRDLQVVGQRPRGRHGVEAGAAKEGEQT